MRYVVTVAGRTVEVDLRGDRPVVDGREVSAELRTLPGTHFRSLIVDGESHAVEATRTRRNGVWRIGVGGRTLEVEALDERARAIREMAGGDDAEIDNIITAPMPGMVMRINVEVGAEVAAGQGVIVVEAMKMENELKAPGAGVVARIEVAIGQAVEKGAVLIVLE